MKSFLRLAAAPVACAILAVGDTRAQGIAECAAADCAPRSAAQPSPALSAMQQVWQGAGVLHESKLRFIAAIQRVTRAQAGLVGDERPELESAVGAMRGTLGEWDAGVAQFLEVTSRLTLTADLKVARGTVLLDRHRMADALRELDEAARMDPDRGDVPALQALALGAQGRTDLARRAFGRAASRAPENPVPAYGQAAGAVGTSDLAEARRLWTRVAQLLAPRMAAATAPSAPFDRVGLIRQAPGVAPLFPLGRYVDAYQALASNDFPAAVSAFERAVLTDPLGRSGDPVRATVARATESLRRGQVAEARRLGESAVQEAPADAEAHRVLARVLWADDAPEAALDHAATALRLSGGDERARLFQAEVLEAEGRLAEASRSLQDAVKSEPRSGTAHYRLALLYQAEGRLSDARAALDQCARLQPVVGQDHIYFLQGSTAVNQADFGAAIEAYRRRVEVNPNNTEAHRQLAELYFLQGRDEEALAEHSVAVFLLPRNEKAHAGRGQALLRLQRYPEAVAAFRQAVASGDDRPETRYGLGMALTRDGHPEEGRSQIDASQALRAKTLVQGQAEFELAALRRAAAVEQAAGRHDDAIALLERALALDSASPRARQELGVALLAAGKAGPAAAQLRQALEAEPTVEGAAALATALAALGDEAGRASVLSRQVQIAEERRRDRVRALTGAP